MNKKHLSGASITLLDNRSRQALGKSASELHIHDEVQILAGISGILEVSVNSKKSNLRVGDVMIINSRTPHKTKAILPFTSTASVCLPASELFFSSFPREYSALALALAQSEESFIYLRRENEATTEIFSTISRMSEEETKKDKAHTFFTDGYSKILIGLLHRNGIINDLSTLCDLDSISKISPVFTYIEENISREITLEDVAKLVGMNREYFCRFFKKATGVTLVDHINFIRITRAEELLVSTQESISSISDALGFSSVSYFTRVFKNITTFTPASYREIKHCTVI